MPKASARQSMSLFKKKKICVTHDSTFHADDLFATATLSILNKGNIKIIRTRNPKIIEKGDYVYDVGGIYDEEKDLFDHHQKGGAGKRENGIPYASFGLVWKKYGEEICGSKKVAEKIDRKIAQPIDAIDNGVDIVSSIYKGVSSYGADQVFLDYIPTWKESNRNIDSIFRNQVKRVHKLLEREIEVTKADVEGIDILTNAYSKSGDKRIIVIDNSLPRYLYQSTLSVFEEPIYLVYPSGHSGGLWKVEAIRKNPTTMENRKSFPESWRGYFDGDKILVENTGVSDAYFSHKGGFLMGALSYEGALALAQKALLA